MVYSHDVYTGILEKHERQLPRPPVLCVSGHGVGVSAGSVSGQGSAAPQLWWW